MQVWKRLRSPYHRCPACDYWLTATDIYCPNCHTLPRPHQAFLPRKLVLFTASVVAIHGICQGIAQATNPAATLGWELVWRQVLLGAGTWGAVVLGSRWLLKQSLNLEIFPPQPSPSLQDDEDKISQRLGDLAERAKPILVVQERARKITNTGQRTTIEGTLDRAMGILVSHRDRYRTKLWEIDLIRWHNALKPLIDRWPSQLQQNSEGLYHLLDTVRDRGEALLHDWEQTDLTTTAEGSKHLERLRAALVSCDRMYQDLIARQAAEAVQGISHFEVEPQFSYNTQEAARQLDVFEALPTVVDFASGLEDLEDEYHRLLTEQDLAHPTPDRLADSEFDRLS